MRQRVLRISITRPHQNEGRWRVACLFLCRHAANVRCPRECGWKAVESMRFFLPTQSHIKTWCQLRQLPSS